MNAGRGNKRQERLAVRVVEFGHAVGRRPRALLPRAAAPETADSHPGLLDAGTIFGHAAHIRIAAGMQGMMRTENWTAQGSHEA